jgi:hypothetical protein
MGLDGELPAQGKRILHGTTVVVIGDEARVEDLAEAQQAAGEGFTAQNELGGQ